MLKTVLVPNPNMKFSGGQYVADPYVSVGLLSIATVLHFAGANVRIVDINRACASLDPREAADEILRQQPDVIGFSTQVNEYPRTLQIAAMCKRERSSSTIVLGGPQATTTDVATLNVFPFIDIVVRGECEENIAAIVTAIGERGSLVHVPGVSFRKGGQVFRTGDPAPVDMQRLPMPDYGLFPNIEMFERMPLEVGRGCPFGCTFCSTKDFFQRRFRFRQTERLLELMARLHNERGVRHFSFQHDNISVSRTKMRDLCDGIRSLGLDLTWSCSARADCLDDETVDRMAEAGCRGVFLGIETGSPRMQKVIGKRLNLDKVVPLTETLTSREIDYTVSFMMGFREETLEDLEMTIRLLTLFRFKGNRRERVQLHMASAFPGTRMHRENLSNLFFDGHFSDTVVADLSEEMRAMVQEHPEIFTSFYYVGNEFLDRQFLLRVNFLVLTLMYSFPYTSLALSQALALRYPHQLFDSPYFADLPNCAWAAASNETRVNSVYKLVKGFIRNLGADAEAVEDLLEYEKIANDLQNGAVSDEAQCMKEFRHDVEGWIAKAESGSVPPLSSLCQPQSNRILFLEKDGEVRTVVMPGQSGQHANVNRQP